MTDTHALAARIEVAIHDVGRYNSDENITAALAALADYKRRVSELEAFVADLAAYEYKYGLMDYNGGMDMAKHYIAEEARALLAAGSEVGDGR